MRSTYLGSQDKQRLDLGKFSKAIRDRLTGGLFISDPSFKYYRNILPTINSIFNVYVDSNGNIYAGTAQGLGISTDKGDNFSIKTTANGLGSNIVREVHVDSLGTIYAATNGGLSISTDGGTSFINKTTANGLGDNLVNSVYVHSSGTIYAGTERGLSISTDGGISFINKGKDNGLGLGVGNIAVDVNGVYVDSLGKIYVATGIGLSISTDGGSSFTTKGNLGIISGVYVDSSGKIYAGTKSGLSISTDGGTTFNTRNSINSGLPWNSVDRFYVDSLGNIYAVTLGILSISTDGGTKFTKKVVRSQGRDVYVYDVYKDSDGTIYAANEVGLGISTNEGTSFRYETIFSALASNLVKDVYVDDFGTIYATTNNGLSISTNDGINFSNKTTGNGLGSDDVRAVYVDSFGNIYTATANGLSISTNGGKSFTNKTTTSGLGSNVVQGVYVDNLGNIYAATNGGLSISTDNGNTFINKTSANGLGTFANQSVNDVYVDSLGTIYAATNGGLSISTNKGTSFTNKTITSGLGSNDIKGVYVDNLGNIYAATYAGLSISTDNGNTFINKTSANGLESNNVNSVYVDNFGKIYVATNGGGLGISTDGGNTFLNKTTSNGLTSNNVTAVHVGKSGKIYAALLTNGVTNRLSYENNIKNWQAIEFIFKNDTRIKRHIIKLDKGQTSSTTVFDSLGMFECVKIRIQFYQADSLVIYRDQFAWIFESTDNLYDINVVPAPDFPPYVVYPNGSTRPPDGSYRASRNDVFEYTVTFNEPVYVEGEVFIHMSAEVNRTSELGSTFVFQYFSIPYFSGSGTNTLKFRYVIPVDLAPQLNIQVFPQSNLIDVPEGSSIKDAGGNNANRLDISTPGNRGIFSFNDDLGSFITYAESSYLNSTDVEIPAYVVIPSPYTFSLGYSQDIQITNPLNLELNIVIGSRNRKMKYLSHNSNTIVFSYEIQPRDEDLNGITISGLNLNGATIVNATSQIPANNYFTQIQTNNKIVTNLYDWQSPNWTLRTTPIGKWNKVIYGNNKFVVVGDNDAMMYSTSGITWSSGNFTDPVLSGANWQGVCYSLELDMYVAVASTGTHRVATSSDGITWTLQNATQANEWVSVSYGNDVFCAVSRQGSIPIMYSSNGITWSNSDINISTVSLSGAQHISFENYTFTDDYVAGTSNGRFVISGDNQTVPDTRIVVSFDGKNFSSQVVDSNRNNITTPVVKSSFSAFVGLSQLGVVRHSNDLIAWDINTALITPYSSTFPTNNLFNTTFSDLTFGFSPRSGQAFFLAVCANRGDSGNIVLGDPTGLQWNVLAFDAEYPTTSNWNSICYANGVIVVVRNDPFTSPNMNVATFTLF